MATKRSKLLSKNKRVKAVARERIGSPKPARIVEERSRKSRPKRRSVWLQTDED